MIRKTPTERLDVLGNIGKPPKDAVGYYIESVQQNKNFIKPPTNDNPYAESIEMLALKNDKEHKTMLALQKQMMEVSSRQEQINEMRVKYIYKIYAELRHGFAETNAFIKTCDDKKQQAKRIILTEQKRHEELRKANAKYIEDIRVLTEFKGKLLNVVKELEPYETVMKQVVAENKDRFSSVKDCMDRCDAILLANAEIEKMKKEKLEQIKNRRVMLVKLCNDASLKVLQYMNELSAVNRDYEKACSDCLKWQKVLSRIKDSIDEKWFLRMRMKECIHSMYAMLCRRRGLAVKQLGVVAQVDFIRDEMRILQKVLELCQKKEGHS